MNKAKLRPNGVIVKVRYKKEDNLHMFFIGQNNKIVELPSISLNYGDGYFDKNINLKQIQFIHIKWEPKEGYTKKDITLKTTNDFSKIKYKLRACEKLNINSEDNPKANVHDFMKEKCFIPFIKEYMDKWYSLKKIKKKKDKKDNKNEIKKIH